jgi:hypothetical protein
MPTEPNLGDALASRLLVDRLNKIDKRLGKLSAQYADLRGDVNALEDEHIRDPDTGHFECHVDAGEDLDEGETEDEESTPETPATDETSDESD